MSKNIEQYTGEEILGTLIDSLQSAGEREINKAVKEIRENFGFTGATEFEPMTAEEIINELNTMWEEV